MSRKEFIETLEKLLAGIPSEERNEALQYYEYYFEDAGEENETKVITELGSPENVANMIKADLKEDNSGKGEFTENGYNDSRFVERDSPVPRPNRYKRAEGGYTYRSTAGENYSRNTYESDDSSSRGNAYNSNTYNSTYNNSTHNNSSYNNSTYNRNTEDNGSYRSTGGEQVPPRTGSALKIVLVILIALVLIPFTWPFLLGIAAIVAALVLAVFMFFAGLVIGALSLTVAGIVILILGLTKLFTIPPIGLVVTGTGLIVSVLGVIATTAAVKLCIIVYPAVFRGIVNICRLPFHRRAVS